MNELTIINIVLKYRNGDFHAACRDAGANLSDTKVRIKEYEESGSFKLKQELEKLRIQEITFGNLIKLRSQFIKYDYSK